MNGNSANVTVELQPTRGVKTSRVTRRGIQPGDQLLVQTLLQRKLSPVGNRVVMVEVKPKEDKSYQAVLEKVKIKDNRILLNVYFDPERNATDAPEIVGKSNVKLFTPKLEGQKKRNPPVSLSGYWRKRSQIHFTLHIPINHMS